MKDFSGNDIVLNKKEANVLKDFLNVNEEFISNNDMREITNINELYIRYIYYIDVYGMKDNFNLNLFAKRLIKAKDLYESLNAANVDIMPDMDSAIYDLIDEWKNECNLYNDKSRGRS